MYFPPVSGSEGVPCRVVIDSGQISTQGADGTEIVTIGITISFEKQQGVTPRLNGVVSTKFANYKLRSRLAVDAYSETWSAS